MYSQKIIDRIVDPQLEEEIRFMLNQGMISDDEANFLYRYCRW